MSWVELTRLGIELGVRGVQRWRADRREDLSDGAHRQSACAADIRVVSRRVVGPSLPNAFVLRLSRADGWQHTRWVDPATEIRVTLRREKYLLVGLLLWVPPDPERQQQLLALGIRQVPFAAAGVEVTLVAEHPTRRALRRADLLLPDGSVPFELPALRFPRRPITRRIPTPGTPKVSGVTGPGASYPAARLTHDEDRSAASLARLREVREALGGSPSTARPARLPPAVGRSDDSAVSSQHCGARAPQGGACRKRVQRAGLCGNHLARAELGRAVTWHQTGRPVRLGPGNAASMVSADAEADIANHDQHRPEALDDRDGPAQREKSQDRFIRKIKRRGFWLPTGAKYIYYQAHDYIGRKPRIVIRGTRVRLEKFNKKSCKYELWRSYGIADETDLALREIDEPKNRFIY